MRLGITREREGEEVGECEKESDGGGGGGGG